MSRPKHMRWDTDADGGRWNRLLKEDRRRSSERQDDDAEEMAEPIPADVYRTILIGYGCPDMWSTVPILIRELPPESLTDFRAIGWISEYGEHWYEDDDAEEMAEP